MTRDQLAQALKTCDSLCPECGEPVGREDYTREDLWKEHWEVGRVNTTVHSVHIECPRPLSECGQESFACFRETDTGWENA